jgi:hypothetical protein
MEPHLSGMPGLTGMYKPGSMVITCSQKRLKSDTNCECTYEMAMSE